MKERPGGSAYGLYANGSGNDRAPIGEVYIGGYRSAIGTAQLAAQHLDAPGGRPTTGTCWRSTSTARRPRSCSLRASVVDVTSPLKLGGNAIWGEWFGGQIDEVRVYNRALTATEIQTDMNTSDHEPGRGRRRARRGQLRRRWLDLRGAVDVGGRRRTTSVSFATTCTAARVRVHAVAARTGSRSRPASAYTDTGRRRHLLLPGHRGGRGRQRRPGLERGSRDRRDTRRRRRRARCRRSGAVGQATLSWGAATDNVGVVRYNVHRGTSAGVHAFGGEPDRAADRDRLRRQHGAGLVLLPGDRRGRGRERRACLERGGSDRTADTTAPTAPAGLIGVGDREHGHLSWTAVDRQRRRRPLQPPPGHARAGFTPTPGEPDRAADRYQLRRQRASRPAATSTRSPPRTRPATSAPPRTRAAATIADATAPSAPGTLTAAGHRQHRQPQLDRGHRQRRRQPATTSTAAPPRLHPQRRQPDRATHRHQLRDTGLAPGTYFYKVTAEDAAGNVGPARTPPPPPSADTTRADRPGRAERRAAPALQPASPGPPPPTTSPSSATTSTAPPRAGSPPPPRNRIAQPTGTSYADTGLATGSYFYKVTAEDAAGNISTASNEATATVADATPPSAPGTLTATAAGTHDQPQLGRGQRQRRRRPLQPPPRHQQRLHPHQRQPDRPTHRPQPRRHRPRPRHLLLQGHRRRRRRQHRPRSPTPPPPPSPTPPRPAPPPSTPPAAPAKPPSAGPPPPTTSPSPATTSTAPPAAASPHTTANRIAQPTGTSYTDTGLAAGTYHYKLTAEDAAGNTSPHLQPSHRHRHRPTPSPASSPPTGSTPAAAPPSPTNPAPATTAPRQRQQGRPHHRPLLRQRPDLQRQQRRRHRARHPLARPHYQASRSRRGSSRPRSLAGAPSCSRSGPGYYSRTACTRTPAQTGRTANITPAAPPRSRRHRGVPARPWTATSPPPTTADVIALYVNGAQVGTRLVAGDDPHLHRTAEDWRQQHLGRMVPGRSTKSASTTAP